VDHAWYIFWQTLIPEVCTSNDKRKSAEGIRNEFHDLLAALRPQQAKALRSRFGLEADSVQGREEDDLRAIARELAQLKKRKL
jgi:hypothetical protein